ncbi:MAG: MotA/TolQ/ExbB proton channel family protein [Verrucomicrobiia bacterium]
MLELFAKGGPLMYLIAACSVVLCAVFLERLIHYHRETIHVGDFLRGLANLIRKRKFGEAMHESAGTPGPVAKVVHAAIVHHDKPRPQLKAIVEESAQLEVPPLERYLPALSTIAYAAPLLGFLGTVTGLLDAFSTLSAQSGYATATDLSRGIFQSLIASSAGMAVGIAAFVAYNYLSARVNALLHDMERAGIEVLQLICDEGPEEGIIEFNPDLPQARKEAGATDRS